MPLKGNLEKALLESQNLNESLNTCFGRGNATILEAIEVSLSYVVFIRISHAISISGRSVSLSFFPKRYNKYSMNLIFSGCTMKLRNLIFSTWICAPSAKSLGHKSLWKKLGP